MATKTTEKGTAIELPELRMEMLDVRIRGLTPLLQNRFSEEKARAITDDQAHGAKGPRAARQPEVEFEQARHRMEDGRDAVNALAVKKAIVSAGNASRMKRAPSCAVPLRSWRTCCPSRDRNQRCKPTV
jgi:hypothetical protein